MFPLSTIVLLDFGNAPTVWYLFVIHFVTFVLFVLDRMVVGFTTTYAISAYHHSRCEFEYSIQHYAIKLVSDLQQVGGLFGHYISDVVSYLRNKSWKPGCVGSFNMDWRILVFYPEPEAKDTI
jgi:hypothetical protein